MAVDPIFCVQDAWQDGKLVLSEDDKEYHFRNGVSLPKVSRYSCSLMQAGCLPVMSMPLGREAPTGVHVCSKSTARPVKWEGVSGDSVITMPSAELQNRPEKS